MQKKCSICKQTKDISFFPKHRGRKDGYYNQCKECKNAARNTPEKIEQAKVSKKLWLEKNPGKLSEYTRNYRSTEHGQRYTKNFFLQKLYNITIEEYNSLFEKQNGCCAICGIHQSELTRKLAVDHSHKDGTIRGLLCSKCNTALGLVNENLDIIYSMIDYINNKEIT